MGRTQALSDAAIVDSVAAVFAAPEFERGIRQSIFDTIGGWLRRLLQLFAGLRSESPTLYWVLIVLIAVLVLALLARGAWLFHSRRTARGAAAGGAGGERDGGRARDPWDEAQRAAARGDFTAAAHALYTALLQALSRREQLRLHPSKTIGDYVRELRTRSSGSLGAFRDFARVYEVVVYGLGICDRERYERLLALAGPLMPRETA